MIKNEGLFFLLYFVNSLVLLFLERHNLGGIRLERKNIVIVIVFFIFLSLFILLKTVEVYSLGQKNGEGYILCKYLDSEILGKKAGWNFKLFAIEKGDDKILQGSKDVIIDSFVSNLDNYGEDEILIITGNKGSVYGNRLVILTFENKETKKLYEQKFTKLNPWKVQTSDVDGDGATEISLGVYKKAEFHPIMAKRPFIYDWQENQLVPKWRGSRLARPFLDYLFADIDNDNREELIAIEFLEDGKKLINTYNWKGFGFEGAGESATFQDITDIRKLEEEDGCKIQAFIKNEEKTTWDTFVYNGGKLLKID